MLSSPATADARNERPQLFTTHSFDADGLVTFEWHRVSAVGPSPREQAGLSFSGDGQRLYVVAGRQGTNALADVWRFDRAAQSWTLLELSSTFAPRYDAGIAVRGDTIFVGGGVDGAGAFLGDLVEIDGLTGGTILHGNVLPAGARPSLVIDDHGDELLYGGGYVGTTWYADLFRVDFLHGSAQSAQFIRNFAGDGMPVTENHAVHGDVFHEIYWAIPGYSASAPNPSVYALRGDVVSGGQGGGTLLRVASGSGTTSPERRTNPRGTARSVRLRGVAASQGAR
jgi:hypothetical protein